MQPDARDPASLADMIEAIDKLTRYLSAKSFSDLLQDEVLQDAVVRRFTVIGEAAARVSPETRALDSGIPWQSIVGLRNVVTHRYDEVDYDELWRAYQRDIPELRERVDRLLSILRQRMIRLEE